MMGSKDFRHRGKKKPKKDAKKPAITEALPAAPPVEIIKTKGKKEKDKW